MAQFYPNRVREVALNGAAEINNGSFATPQEEDFNTEAMRGSMQQIFSENLGEFVVVEFLIGTQTTQQKRGILYSVGRSFIAIYEELSQTFVVCDIFSIKFVTFYMPGQRPGRPILPNLDLPLVPLPTPRGGGSMGGGTMDGRNFRPMSGR